MKYKLNGPIAMDCLKHFQSIDDFYYNNPSQYISFIDILIHVVTTTTTHTSQYQQVQVVA